VSGPQYTLYLALKKECPVIQRRTQTANYWREEFALAKKDEAYLYDLILDGGKPVSTEVLAEALIGRHCRQEEDLIEAELSKGEVYQPKDTYKIGDPIIFPVFEYALATVTGSRPGTNPEYGEFTVIQVQFEGDDEIREFASALEGEHRLNRTEGEAELLVSAELSSPQELYKLHGDAVEAKVTARLETHPDFVRFGEDWFLKDLLVPIDKGYLNIAEAMIEVKARPLTTSDFLPDLDLPAEVAEEIRLLSLSRALEADERFDNIGDMGRDLWYLRRLTPKPVVSPPARLVIEDIEYDRRDISDELLLIEREIDDEGSGEKVMGPSRPIYKTTIALAYPHWRCGTLPLTVRTRGLFPESTNHHTPIVLIDGQSGSRTQGWVVHEEAFVYGLADWYKQYELPVGAYIKLERTRDPRVITVDFEARRLKRLWGTVATVTNLELTFELRKLPIACEYDAQLTVSEDRPQAIDKIWDEVHARRESLLQTMIGMMPKLAELSPQGTVHAKTIYSAVNVLRRVPPGPVFALLSTEACFVPMGGGYWAFDEALV
jgi:hypothetical protein